MEPSTMSSNEQIFKLVKIAGPKLVPFIQAVCLYFVFDAHNHHGEYWSTILKCAPIISLIFFILMLGISVKSNTTKILVALIFSCIGDALLNHEYFEHGICAFAVAQTFYIITFGFEPLKPWIGISLYLAGTATVIILWNNLDSVLLIGLPIYSFLLLTMCWRSIALLFNGQNSRNILRIICAISSGLFVISDAMIAINKFYYPIKNSSMLIMATYYAAQFGLTLSIIDANKLKES